jgi:hypothetical protein
MRGQVVGAVVLLVLWLLLGRGGRA